MAAGVSWCWFVCVAAVVVSFGVVVGGGGGGARARGFAHQSLPRHYLRWLTGHALLLGAAGEQRRKPGGYGGEAREQASRICENSLCQHAWTDVAPIKADASRASEHRMASPRQHALGCTLTLFSFHRSTGDRT